MSFQMYILRSISTGRFYVGHTEYLPQRLQEHNNGRTPSTRGRRPWELYYAQEYPTRAEAARRERQIKGMKNRSRIEQLAGASRQGRESR